MIGSGLGYFRNDDAEEYGRYGEDGPAAKTNLKANTSLGGYGDCRAEKGAISGASKSSRGTDGASLPTAANQHEVSGPLGESTEIPSLIGGGALGLRHRGCSIDSVLVSPCRRHLVLIATVVQDRQLVLRFVLRLLTACTPTFDTISFASLLTSCSCASTSLAPRPSTISFAW
jgi:hypothetical protein